MSFSPWRPRSCINNSTSTKQGVVCTNSSSESVCPHIPIRRPDVRTSSNSTGWCPHKFQFRRMASADVRVYIYSNFAGWRPCEFRTRRVTFAQIPILKACVHTNSNSSGWCPHKLHVCSVFLMGSLARCGANTVRPLVNVHNACSGTCIPLWPVQFHTPAGQACCPPASAYIKHCSSAPS